MINRKTLGIDFDETLCEEQCFTVEQVRNATPRKDFIEKINKLFDENFIVIYTARRNNLISDSLDWLQKHNVKYHAISNIKVPLDKYVDDKALHIDDIGKIL